MEVAEARGYGGEKEKAVVVIEGVAFEVGGEGAVLVVGEDKPVFLHAQTWGGLKEREVCKNLVSGPDKQARKLINPITIIMHHNSLRKY